MHARLGGPNSSGASGDDYSDYSGKDNNDWMTHHPLGPSAHQPLAQWIQDRQRAFADFSNSLQPLNKPFFERDPFFFEELPPIAHQPIANSNRRMLATNEASLSPKAKVSYDEGQFSVEIPLKDYKVRLSLFS